MEKRDEEIYIVRGICFGSERDLPFMDITEVLALIRRHCF